MMELKRVKALLADYYEGITSREEEQLLKEFFLAGNIPAGMEADRQLFMSLHGASEAEIPDKDFDEKLFAAIEIHDMNQRLPGKEMHDQHISKPQSENTQNTNESPVIATSGHQKRSGALLNSKQSSPADTNQQDGRTTRRSMEHGGIRRLVYTISGIAAGLVLLAGSYFLLVERQVQDIVSISGEEQYTTEEAMLAYEEAKNALLLVSKVMNTGTDQLEALSVITEATSDLEMLDRLNQGTNELQMLYKFEEAKNKIMTKD